jgi:hypothetical protein
MTPEMPTTQTHTRAARHIGHPCPVTRRGRRHLPMVLDGSAWEGQDGAGREADLGAPGVTALLLARSDSDLAARTNSSRSSTVSCTGARRDTCVARGAITRSSRRARQRGVTASGQSAPSGLAEPAAVPRRLGADDAADPSRPHARRAHGGALRTPAAVTLSDAVASAPEPDAEILDLAAALTRLATFEFAKRPDRRAASVRGTFTHRDESFARRVCRDRRARVAGSARAAVYPSEGRHP